MSNFTDVQIARFYVSKADKAKSNNHDFTLTFSQFKQLAKKKKCYFTDLPLDRESFTLDRVDNSIGYTKDNTVVCHKSFNSSKSFIENPENRLNLDNMLEALLRWKNHGDCHVIK